MLRLLIEDSEGKSKQAQISPESADITIGRKAGNVIRLKERNVSREHARIYQNEEGLFVAPVAARYGMKINGKKIDGPTHIELGDEIRIGDYRLYVQDENKPTMTPAEEAAQAFEKGEALPLPQEQQPRLVVVSSNFAGRECPITSTRCSIGRAPENDICFNHSSVSSKHAEIYRNGRGNFEIRNLSSSNGTKVNGMDISNSPHELQSGEFLTFGLVTTRFCAPGELWFFNFGAASVEPKRNTGLIIALVSAVIVLVIVLTFFITLQFNNNNNQPQQPPQPVPTDDSTAKAVELMGLVMDCQNETDNGNFDAAQKKCDEAAAINSADTRLIHAQENLRKEMIAMQDLQTIQDDIANGHCREALNAIKDLDNGTYAFKQLQIKDSSGQTTVERAQECLEDSLYERARNSLEANDISDAQAALEEIKSKGRPNSPLVAQLEADIKAKKGERNKNTTTRPKDTNKTTTPQPTQPADSSAGMSIDEICAMGTLAKKNKDPKKVCEYGKKAIKKGGDGACKGFAKKWVSDYCN